MRFQNLLVLAQLKIRLPFFCKLCFIVSHCAGQKNAHRICVFDLALIGRVIELGHRTGGGIFHLNVQLGDGGEQTQGSRGSVQ